MMIMVDATPTWLTVGSANESATVLRVEGGIVADRTGTLWDAIERALESTAGRRVIVDLAGVTGFDIGSIHELAHTASTALRRHDDVHVVLRRRSALDHYIHCANLTDVLPLHYSVTNALAAP